MELIKKKDLILDYDKGMAYQEDRSNTVPYDKDYFEKYVKYENNTHAKDLNEGRVNIVKKYCNGLPVLDIGIGAGTFIKSYGEAYGYDVNPYGIAWLKERGIWCDAENGMSFPGITFWDSLEHISEATSFLNKIAIKCYVFVSIPIYKDLDSIFMSKHYRPDEHFIHFTKEGFTFWMKERGFSFLELSDFEIKAGREDIYTFVFIKNEQTHIKSSP